MPGEPTDAPDDLTDRLARGDVEAAKQLTGRFYSRLTRIAGAIYHRSFPSLEGRHDLDSILNQAWIRMAKALEKRCPRTAEDVFNLAVRKIRHVMLDEIRKQRRDDARRLRAIESAGHSDSPPRELADSSLDPARLALWTEFQDALAKLPADERNVFLLHGFGECTQAQVAVMMGLPPHKVSRLWLAAAAKLADSVEAIRERV
jgi:RNA polymerase sigma factor (sigma-70 family)